MREPLGPNERYLTWSERVVDKIMQVLDRYMQWKSAHEWDKIESKQ